MYWLIMSRCVTNCLWGSSNQNLVNSVKHPKTWGKKSCSLLRVRSAGFKITCQLDPLYYYTLQTRLPSYGTEHTTTTMNKLKGISKNLTQTIPISYMTYILQISNYWRYQKLLPCQLNKCCSYKSSPTAVLHWLI